MRTRRVLGQSSRVQVRGHTETNLEFRFITSLIIPKLSPENYVSAWREHNSKTKKGAPDIKHDMEGGSVGRLSRLR